MLTRDSLQIIEEKAEPIARLIRESENPHMAVVITKDGLRVKTDITILTECSK